jgi:hypothetical protein
MFVSFAAAAAAQVVVAQSPPSQPVAPTPIAAPVAAKPVLRAGTEVLLRLSEDLTTKGKQLRAGQRFHLETSQPVLVQGTNVIPVGSPAVGEITDVRNKGMWGKSGHLAAQILYVTVNGRLIRLRGALNDKGAAGGIGAVAVSAIVWLPAGLFMTGTSAKVPAGTIVKAFIDEDVPLAIANATSPPAQAVRAVSSGEPSSPKP